MMLLAGLTAPEARERLARAGGVMRRALQAGEQHTDRDADRLS
jgi:N-acetylmuramic acid 6-phosphate (MurNAc-6-P) etherase